MGVIWMSQLYGLIRMARPAIVHTATIWTHIFAGLTARMTGRLVVWHLQDIVGPTAGFGLYRWFLQLWAGYVPHQIICVSEAVAMQLGTAPRVCSKVIVLWNAIDTGQAIYSRPACVPPDDVRVPVVGTVARLTPWKGHEVVLRAAARLRERGVDFRWRIAGDESLGSPGYHDYLASLISALDLADRVSLVGWQDDMPAFYRSLDLLVHPPIEPEPFGLVLAEAIVAGLPVIATRGGGIDALVEAGVGILVPPGRPDALADAVSSVLSDLEDWQRRAGAARTVAVRAFDIGGYIGKLVDIYESLEGSVRNV